MPKNAIRQPNEDELKIINTHFAKKELKAEDIYVFSVDAADNDTLTGFYSRLGTDMIEGFHKDVMARRDNPQTEIIGYLFGHNTHEIPSGTLFDSELVQVQEGESKLSAFHPSVYMAKGLTSGGIGTDDYIKAYEAGHTEAVSVGFQAGSFICDLCNEDIRGFKCSHYPGGMFNIAKEDETPIMKQCTYTVHQGKVTSRNLIELSGVYAGAMPGKRVKGEFSIPENSILAMKDGKITDPRGNVFGSTNIKDFKETDILRFNFQFDGSIEKVGETDMSSEEVKAILDKLKLAEETILTLKKNLEDLQGQYDVLKPLLDKTQVDLEVAKAEQGMERNRHLVTAKNLSLSEVDKVDLQKSLGKANKTIEKLQADLRAQTAIAGAYIQGLKDRCSKLSIQINGMNHKQEIFDKEISSLSVEDLKLKIEGFEKQLAQSIPNGKQTETKTMIIREQLNQGSVDNPALHKFKK